MKDGQLDRYERAMVCFQWTGRVWAFYNLLSGSIPMPCPWPSTSPVDRRCNCVAFACSLRKSCSASTDVQPNKEKKQSDGVLSERWNGDLWAVTIASKEGFTRLAGQSTVVDVTGVVATDNADFQFADVVRRRRRGFVRRLVW